MPDDRPAATQEAISADGGWKAACEAVGLISTDASGYDADWFDSAAERLRTTADAVSGDARSAIVALRDDAVASWEAYLGTDPREQAFALARWFEGEADATKSCTDAGQSVDYTATE